MKLRSLGILALVLAVAAVTAWFWFEHEGATPSVSDAREEAARTASEPAHAAAALPSTRDGQAPDLQVPPAKPPEPVRITSAVDPGMPLVRTTPAPLPANVPARPAPRPFEGPAWQTEGKEDLEGVRSMLRDFRTRMGENPVGSNAEIMKAVMGGNEAKATLGPPAGQQLNDNGELLDRWGTPYFFHQISSTNTEIRSAGPDGRLWTSDDMVVK